MTVDESEAEPADRVIPPDVLTELLQLWIKARRRDEGSWRPIKKADLEMQVNLTRANVPILTLIRAAYRRGYIEAQLDQEEQP